MNPSQCITIRHFSRIFSAGSRKFYGTQASTSFFTPVWKHEFAYDALEIAMAKQQKELRLRREARKERGFDIHYGNKRRRLDTDKTREWDGTNEDVLAYEVERLLLRRSREADSTIPSDANPDPSLVTSGQQAFEIAVDASGDREVEVVELSSTGDGLAISKHNSMIYVVPYAIPGDVIKVRVSESKPLGKYQSVDLLDVLVPSKERDDSLIQCKYFAKCGGCQFQMLSYEKQLAKKRETVESAFRNFSGLAAWQIPRLEETMGSPLSYGYRTKLTPWFHKVMADPADTPIGFSMRGRRYAIDIENCPLATPVVQEGLKHERARVRQDMATGKYKRGATLLIRESTKRYPVSPKTATSDHAPSPPSPPTTTLTTTSGGLPLLKVHHSTYTDHKTCQTDMADYSTEYVDTHAFTNRAGAFFQNNNSILSPFIAHIRDRLFPPILSPHQPPLKYLLDAYCGSGLFSITLSPFFKSTLGIDIDQSGITAARTNAADNGVRNAGFIDADAANLFEDVPFPPDQTVCFIDPPRKGCSRDFLRQLMRFGPKRVVYVSCNVHTQARDVGWLVNGWAAPVGGEAWKEKMRLEKAGAMDDEERKVAKEKEHQELTKRDDKKVMENQLGLLAQLAERVSEDGDTEKGEGADAETDRKISGSSPRTEWRYELESLKGFDFFPQTAHVEGLAFLNRVEKNTF